VAANIAAIDGMVSTRIKDITGLGALLSESDRYNCIRAAVAEYSGQRPQALVALLTGAGSFDFTLSATNFPSWSQGFSAITSVLYPYTATNATSPALARWDYGIVLLPVTGYVLRLLSGEKPTASQKLLVYYTAPHAVTASASSVSASDDEALADLSACYGCNAMAAQAQQGMDGSISADSVNRLSRSAEYRSQATRWRDAYRAKMGLDGSAVPATILLADIPQRPVNPGARGLLFHGLPRAGGV
jgi:hypothetical protein